MEEQLDKINRLGEEISVEFLPVDEGGYISQRVRLYFTKIIQNHVCMIQFLLTNCYLDN